MTVAVMKRRWRALARYQRVEAAVLGAVNFLMIGGGAALLMEALL